MPDSNTRIRDFRKRLLQGVRLTGLFVRLIQPEVAELLADTELDFVILDAEHGTFAYTDVSRFVFAAQASGLPVIVRLPDASIPWLQHAISAGAMGVSIPHVQAVQALKTAVEFCRGTALERAYAGMGRLSQYRKQAWPDFRREAGENLVVMAQLDEPAGVEVAQAVARLKGVDCVFLGSLGLALAMGANDPGDPRVADALHAICQACADNDCRVGMHLMNANDKALWAGRGVSLFVVGNDYELLRTGAGKLVEAFSQA